MNCQCQKGPCICGKDICSNKTCPKSTKIQNIDENGNTHYVESIYKKISLNDNRNGNKADADIDYMESSASTLYSTIIEDNTGLNCNDCCEHLYAKPAPNLKHDCKVSCNITAELYCQIRRQYAEPGEIISQCSTSLLSNSDSSIDSENQDDSEEYVGDRSTEYASAQAKTEDNSETTYDVDDDIFHSTMNEDTPVFCEHQSCCSLNQHGYCKKKKLRRKSQEELLVTIDSDIQNLMGDANKQSNKKVILDVASRPKIRQKIEDANNQLTADGTQQQKESAELEATKSQTRKKIDISEDVIVLNKNEETTDIVPSKRKKRLDQNAPGEIDDREEEKRRGDDNIPRNSEDSNIQLYGNNYVREVGSDFSLKYKNTRQQKHVTLFDNDNNKDSGELKVIVNQRKRKYGSTQNDIFDVNRESVVPESRRTSVWTGRKKRITLKNFVSEEQFIEDDETSPDKGLKKPPSKPDHRDAFYVLETSRESQNKNSWSTYVPCERSDFTLENRELAKKSKGVMPSNDLPQSLIRNIAIPFRPKKLLCFKYIPKVTPITSKLQNTSITHLYVDPPEPLPVNSVISKAKLLGSRIPVSMAKDKADQKGSFHYKKPINRNMDDKSRRTVLGDIPNVLEEKSMQLRRSMIPPELRKSLLPKNMMPKASPSISKTKNRKSKQNSVEISMDGSASSLRNKMKKFYMSYSNESRVSEESVDLDEMWQQAQKDKKTEPTGIKKKKLQKTCCSQTGIHVCIKESLLTKKGVEESNVLQMVNIDVTPKNSNLVKVNVMPTVPEINKEGVITIPVQLQLYNQLPEEENEIETIRYTEEELLYQASPKNNYEHYIRDYLKDVKEDNILQQKPYAPETHKYKDATPFHDDIEIQTDLTLGKKLLSKSLNSITSKESSSSLLNKSAPVKTNIDWDNILLPPPGTFVIKKVPKKKSIQRRVLNEHYKTKDNEAPPSTSAGGLPPSEEFRNRNQSSDGKVKNKFKFCCPIRQSQQDEPYRPASKQSSKEKDTTVKRELPPEDEPPSGHSNIISLVFSKTHLESQNENEREVPSCPSKPEITWTNILIPSNLQTRRIEKLDASKTSTSITDQTETSNEEYISKTLSTKTTDTGPNLSEDTYSYNKNDKGTNTSVDDDEESTITSSYTRKHILNRNVSSNPMDILKAFKEDPVLSAFKAFEEELKPVRRALAEVQNKLRALNIPELECLFKKDTISEYALSSSNSQIEGEYRQPMYTYDNGYFRPSEIFDQYSGPSNDPRLYRFVMPPGAVRSRNLSTDIWKAFGSCERNTIKGHYDKFWTSPNIYNMRNADSYNCSSAYDSRNSTPESDIQYVSFNSSGLCHHNKTNYFGPYVRKVVDKRYEMIHDDDYPSTYTNTPTTPPALSRQNFYGNNSEHSINSSITERLIPNHILQPKISASFHAPSGQYNCRCIPVKVRPISPFFLQNNEGPGLRNRSHSSMRNTSMKHYVRRKTELPKVYKPKKMSVYPEPNEMYHYTNSEYDTYKYKRPHEYSNVENPSVYSNYYKEYLKNERYT